MKRRIIALLVGLALLTAVAGTSANVTGELVTVFAPDGQAVACNHGGHSGGGC
jgi:hypothetical protein